MIQSIIFYRRVKNRFFWKIRFFDPPTEKPETHRSKIFWLSEFFTKPYFHAKFQAIWWKSFIAIRWMVQQRIKHEQTYIHFYILDNEARWHEWTIFPPHTLFFHIRSLHPAQWHPSNVKLGRVHPVCTNRRSGHGAIISLHPHFLCWLIDSEPIAES